MPKRNKAVDLVTGAAKLPARLRLRYHFDNLLAAGTRGLVAWLVWATVALILSATVVSSLLEVSFGGGNVTFGEALWQNLLRALDPGTMGADIGWPLRAVSLFVTVGGVLIVSTLIGLLANGVGRLFEDLNQGRTVVAESDHTLILGWSTKVHTLLGELVTANKGKLDASVAILAPREKGAMDREIATRLGDSGPTRIVVRSGTPYEEADLRIVSPQRAESLILLRPEEPDGDAFVVRTALALLKMGLLDGGKPCIAEVKDPGMARQLSSAIPDRIHVIQSQDIMARITAQVCRQPGLSAVYQDLLDFEGDEIYFHADPALAGKTFGHAVFGYRDATALGIRRADGSIVMKPPRDAPLEDGDVVILLARDGASITYDGSTLPNDFNPVGRAHAVAPESFLIVGWSSLAPGILRELDGYVAPGSRVDVWAPSGPRPDESRLDKRFQNIEIKVRKEDGEAPVLEEHLSGRPPDHVLLLCEREGVTPAVADAKALMTLLQARQITERSEKPPNIVAELLDERDVALIPNAGTEEFIVSERLTSLLMAQIAEDGERGPVFEDLLNAEGAEIYVKPAGLYVDPGEDLSFLDLCAAALARDEVALGYRIGDGQSTAPEVVVNPNKSTHRALGPGDGVVVLADRET